MRRFVIPLFLSALFLLSLCIPGASANPHATHLTGTTPSTLFHQYTYLNVTVAAGVTVTYDFTESGNHWYEVGYKGPNNVGITLKNDVRILEGGQPAHHCVGTLTVPQTGLYRFWFYSNSWWDSPSAGMAYDISYTSPDSGNVVRLVNVDVNAPFIYDLAYFNNTYYGLFTCGAGSSVDGIQGSWFLPDLAGTVDWRSNMSVYDGTTLLHTWAFPQVTAAGYAEVSIGTYADPNAAWKCKQDVITNTGHVYYFNLDLVATDHTSGAFVASYHASITVREGTALPPSANWVNGILWMLIIFFPAWMLNWVFPRYGLVLGLALMFMVLGFTQTSALWVSFMSFLVLGSMLFTMRSD